MEWKAYTNLYICYRLFRFSVNDDAVNKTDDTKDFHGNTNTNTMTMFPRYYSRKSNPNNPNGNKTSINRSEHVSVTIKLENEL